MTRKLASIQVIKNLLPIEGADHIELALVLGWQVVVKKSIHKVGDNVIFYEIDSFLPASDLRYDSFKERFTEWESVLGMRLKTIKLRKQLSQGLIMPVELFKEEIPIYNVGDDVTEVLGIEKWEMPEKEYNGSRVSGKTFPHFIRKTDQERVQNCGRLVERKLDEVFEVTLKMDGSSLTVFRLLPESRYYKEFVEAHPVQDGEIAYGICSRNLLLKMEGESNFHVGGAKLLAALREIPVREGSIAIQAELLAPNIQSNYEKVDDVEVHVFDIFSIDSQTYLDTVHRHQLTYYHVLQHGAKHAKALTIGMLRSILGFEDGDNVVKLALDYANGDGYNVGVKREGVVFKSLDSEFTFKAVSNEYLLASGK